MRAEYVNHGSPGVSFEKRGEKAMKGRREKAGIRAGGITKERVREGRLRGSSLAPVDLIDPKRSRGTSTAL